MDKSSKEAIGETHASHIHNSDRKGSRCLIW